MVDGLAVELGVDAGVQRIPLLMDPDGYYTDVMARSWGMEPTVHNRLHPIGAFTVRLRFGRLTSPVLLGVEGALTGSATGVALSQRLVLRYRTRRR